MESALKDDVATKMQLETDVKQAKADCADAKAALQHSERQRWQFMQKIHPI